MTKFKVGDTAYWLDGNRERHYCKIVKVYTLLESMFVDVEWETSRDNNSLGGKVLAAFYFIKGNKVKDIEFVDFIKKSKRK